MGRAKELAQEGEAHDDAGRFAEALALYREAVSLWPAFGAAEGVRARMLAAILNNLGVVALELEALDEAEAAFARGIALHPADASLHANRGLALLRAGGTAAALERAHASLREAARLDPTDGEALRLAASALYHLGRLAPAARALQRALLLLDPPGAAAVFWPGAPPDAAALPPSGLLPAVAPDGGAQAVDAWLQLATLHAAPAECLPPAPAEPFEPSAAMHALALARAAAAADALGRLDGGAADARARTFQAHDPPHARLAALARARASAAAGSGPGSEPEGRAAGDGEVEAKAAAGPGALARASVRQAAGGGLSAVGALGEPGCRPASGCPRDASELTVDLSLPAAGCAGGSGAVANASRGACAEGGPARAARLLRTHGAVVVVGVLGNGSALANIAALTAPGEAGAGGAEEEEGGALAAAVRRLAAAEGADATRGLRAREHRTQTTLPCAAPPIRAALAALMPTLAHAWGVGGAARARLAECALLETRAGAGPQALHRDVRPAGAEPGVGRCGADVLALQLLPAGVRAFRAGALEVVSGSHRGDALAAVRGADGPCRPCEPLALGAPRGAAIIYDPRVLHRGGAHAGDPGGLGRARLAIIVRLLHEDGLSPRDLPYAIGLADVGRHTAGGLAA